MRNAITTAYQVFLTAVIVFTCVYLYASSPLRKRIEDRLYDLRTRLSPTRLNSDDIAIVTISETDIARLGQASGVAPQKDISYDGLQHLIQALQKSDARIIAVLLHAQIFHYDDNVGLSKIAALADADPRIIVGTNKLGTANSTSEAIPSALRSITDQVGNIEATREFRRDIVRRMTVEKPEGTPYLIQRLATKLGVDDRFKLMPIGANGQRQMRLNYFDPSSIMTYSASDIITGQGLQNLAGRTVLIGYVAFRPWTAYMLDATHLNSPWRNDGAEVDASSMPLVTLQAEALTNLLRTAWLEDASIWIVVLQGFLTVSATLLFWRTTTGFACFLFIGGWASLIIISSLVFAFLQLYIPLADSLIASVVAMAFGATLRLRGEGKHRAAAEAAAASHAELASIQHRFLDRFTSELSSINRRVCDLIAFDLPAGATSTLTTAHERMRSSCTELDEYLVGMEQLNSLDGISRRRKPSMQPVILAEAIQRIVRQFEARADESSIKFEVACAPDLCVFADDYLLRQILFNLVSNAVKYSPPRSKIRIHAFTERKQARISVSDEGPGIAEDFHEKIFEKFYRVKDDHVYKVKGHGLGLYLCRYFCEQIDASIALSSTLGRGSTFTLTLRAAEVKTSR